MAVTRKEFARHSKRVTSTRRWQVLRHQIQERDGWKCRCCGERRRLEIDHIKPVRTHPELAFDPRNLQALCGPCHTRKTRIECGHKEVSPARKAWDRAVSELAPKNAGWSIPYGATFSAVPLTIVCGPPGAGKSTFIAQWAAPDDTVIDYDDYLRAVGGVKWDTNREKVKAAFRMRDRALLGLANQRHGRAWLAMTAPSEAERREWKRKFGPVSFVILDVPPDVCKARIRAAPDRRHAIDPMCAGVDRWWRIFSADLGGQSQNIGEENA